ncbi:MAG: chemotaxis protein CheW, partial [Candidatus Margulisiibacteriota bacterium]
MHYKIIEYGFRSRDWAVFTSEGKRQFGINIFNIIELIEMKGFNLAQTPGMPLHTRGIINHRNKTYPCIDFRILIGKPSLKEELDDIIRSLELIEKQHLMWLDDLDNSIKHKQTFTGILDPKLCTLGKWMQSFNSNLLKMQEMVNKIHEPHNKIHNSGKEINKLLDEKKFIEARNLYNRIKNTIFKTVINAFHEIYDNIHLIQREIGIIIEYEGNKLLLIVDNIDSIKQFDNIHFPDNKILIGKLLQIAG